MFKNFSHLEFSSMFMHIKIIKDTAEMPRLIRLSKNLHKFTRDLTQEESSSHETAWQSQWVSGFSRNDSDSCWLKKVKDTLLKHSSWLDLSLYVVEISRCSVWGYSFRFSQPDIVFSKALLNRLYRSWRRFRRERRFLLTIVNFAPSNLELLSLVYGNGSRHHNYPQEMLCPDFLGSFDRCDSSCK